VPGRALHLEFLNALPDKDFFNSLLRFDLSLTDHHHPTVQE